MEAGQIAPDEKSWIWNGSDWEDAPDEGRRLRTG
jgi:hypothetical protein